MVAIMQYCFLKGLYKGWPDPRHATSCQLSLVAFTWAPLAAWGRRAVPSSALHTELPQLCPFSSLRFLTIRRGWGGVQSSASECWQRTDKAAAGDQSRPRR